MAEIDIITSKKRLVAKPAAPDGLAWLQTALEPSRAKILDIEPPPNIVEEKQVEAEPAPEIPQQTALPALAPPAPTLAPDIKLYRYCSRNYKHIDGRMTLSVHQ